MASFFAGIATLLASPVAQASPTNTDAIVAGRPGVDLRARYETVDDASKTLTVAEAGTFRTRLGYETGAWNGISRAIATRSG